MGETNYFINPLDQLRLLLTEAEIPFESYKEEWPEECSEALRNGYIGIGPADMNKFERNQVIYGGKGQDCYSWKFDAIYHFGAHSNYTVIECWGSLIGGEPKCLTPQGAFEVIKADWEKCNGEKDEGDS